MRRTVASIAAACLSTSVAWAGQDVTGFAEVRAGVRLQDDPRQRTASIGEARLRLERDWEAGRALLLRAGGDLVYDPLAPTHRVDLESGRGFLDLRETSAVIGPFAAGEIKAGRQVLTWGAGDLIFINDLFPKDYHAFFMGRDDQYLKAPSDAVRASLFTSAANVDVVYTPRFDADRFVDGSRLSYFDRSTGRLAGREAVIDPVRRDEWFRDDEVALRVFRHAGPYEVAGYGYHGFWKSPAGVREDGRPTWPRLRAYGASLRGPLAGGILAVEVGFYDSRERGAGPGAPPSEFRALAGLEREARPELTVGVQYYLETEIGAAPGPGVSGTPMGDGGTRHLLTVRLTKLALRQTLTLGAFQFWSPDDGDGYTRLRVSYSPADVWTIEGGGNVFFGSSASRFGQFRQGSSLFAGLRRSF